MGADADPAERSAGMPLNRTLYVEPAFGRLLFYAHLTLTKYKQNKALSGLGAVDRLLQSTIICIQRLKTQEVRRGDRAGICEISSSPQTVGNSGFDGTISFQQVEKFIFSGYDKAREESDKSAFVVQLPRL